LRRGWRIAAICAAVFSGLWVISFFAGMALSPWAEKEFVAALESKFSSTAEVEDLQVRIFPWFHADARGLVFRHRGRTDVPPLVEIERVTADANPFMALIFRHVDEVTLEGLEIRVARKGGDSDDDGQDEQDRNAVEAPPPEPQEPREDISGKKEFVVEHIVADGTHLEILSKHAWKKPLTFELTRLELWDAGPNSPMEYRSTLTNPKPPGEIQSTGHFGPWDGEEPGRTPLDGEYVFEDADLSYFKGIAGILSSEGSFDGILERIEVEGWTDTPDFSVSSSKRPVHLKTEFSAVVDGTSGDTYLEPVRAQFERSFVVARGKVAEEEGLDGKSVILDVRVDRGYVEDMLMLAVPEDEAMLEGPIQFTAKFRLPPGDAEVPARLELDGQFGIKDAQFTQTAIQEKLGKLSDSARGEPEDEHEAVPSDFGGDFRLRGGVLTLTDFQFQIPGADVFLAGDYDLLNKGLDFRGRIEMDAKISEATTGKKSFFLKLLDPFFKNRSKDSGSLIPIEVSGTVDAPNVGLALGGSSQ
jgi:hypothetical protein